MTSIRESLLRPSLNWLLIFLPITIWAEHSRSDSHRLIFFSSCLAIIPLAGLLGQATEHIAARAGEGLGGFLNATFGNAAELIIAIVALKAGQLDVVKASLTGSIIGNVLLVLGASFLAGGLRHRIQSFNLKGASSSGEPGCRIIGVNRAVRISCRWQLSGRAENDGATQSVDFTAALGSLCPVADLYTPDAPGFVLD